MVAIGYLMRVLKSWSIESPTKFPRHYEGRRVVRVDWGMGRGARRLWVVVFEDCFGFWVLVWVRCAADLHGDAISSGSRNGRFSENKKKGVGQAPRIGCRGLLGHSRSSTDFFLHQGLAYSINLPNRTDTGIFSRIIRVTHMYFRRTRQEPHRHTFVSSLIGLRSSCLLFHRNWGVSWLSFPLP